MLNNDQIDELAVLAARAAEVERADPDYVRELASWTTSVPTAPANTGAAIDAVMAWQLSSAYGWYSVGADSQDLIEESRKMLAETIIDAVGAQPPVTIHARVEQGHLAELLLHEAEGADLLVVGSRGHGGFVAALPLPFRWRHRHTTLPPLNWERVSCQRFSIAVDRVGSPGGWRALPSRRPGAALRPAVATGC